MPGFAARAKAALRDPWSLLVTAVGAGSAWAIGLPVVGVAAVGAGVLGAAVVGAGLLRAGDRAAEPDIELRRGTPQKTLVDELSHYRANLVDLQQRSDLAPVMSSSAAEAVSAADSAASVSWRVAAAVDALDVALERARDVARRMPGSGGVRGSVDRMSVRRNELLGKLGGAVNGIGEVYAGLLEVSTSAAMAGLGTDGLDEVGRVNDSLNALRGAFAELERDASASRAML